MLTRTTLHSGAVTVSDIQCNPHAHEQPYTEQHESFSISYVRNGTFGYHTRGQSFDLVAGSILVGRPGREFVCTHDGGACGDECLSFRFAPEVAESISRQSQDWDAGCVPPTPDLAVLGELAQSAAEGKSDLGLDEVGLVLGVRFGRLVRNRRERTSPVRQRDRRRSLDVALWLDTCSDQRVDLSTAAAKAGLSAFHFLRTFTQVVGVTPHQYLIGARLRKAARLLADTSLPVTAVALDAGFNDISNFVRTFHRAAGLSPRHFRIAARGNRKILQERLSTRL